MALFGEKYGDVVRVVSVSGFSKELCGGTHVPASGCIGMVKVLSESSSAAGIRRLEAVTGDAAESFVYALQDKFLQIGAKLNAPEKKIMEKLDNVLSRQTELETELKNAASARLQKQAARLCYEAVKPSGQNKFSYLIAQAEVADNAELQLLADFIRNSVSQTAVVLFARLEDKISISVSASADLGKEFHAGQWAGKIAALVGGKGGGRPDSAMAGGKDVEKLADAIEQTRVLLG
jgi:alanyl-tRNA synthetase